MNTIEKKSLGDILEGNRPKYNGKPCGECNCEKISLYDNPNADQIKCQIKNKPMKLELKHLAPYLPYGLKGLQESNKLIWWLHKESNICRAEDNYHSISINDFLVRKLKPILRPLTDLIEGFELEGEKIFPVHHLHYKSYRVRGSKAKVEPTINFFDDPKMISTKKGIYGNSNGVDIWIDKYQKNEYWINRNLFEWHFDVFGLIDEGLAIDINTLEK